MTEFQHIALSDSYVLGISIEPYRVDFTMDFVLTPEHPEYSAPLPTETECYRRGLIRVANFGTLTWRASNLKASIDATGERDYGSLDELVIDRETVSFRGDWGSVDVTGGHLAVILE